MLTPVDKWQKRRAAAAHIPPALLYNKLKSKLLKYDVYGDTYRASGALLQVGQL